MPATGTVRADRERALAFRIDGHHLARRLPADTLSALAEAAGACGVQDSPPGSAALALHARVAGLTPGAIDRALSRDKSLLQAMSLRGAPLVFPTADAAVFLAGLLPDDEASLRHFIPGAAEGLDRVGMSATELVRRSSEALYVVLDGLAVDKDELGVAIADRIAGGLEPGRRERWRSPSWLSPDQYCGESLVRFALYVVSLNGLFCYGQRDNKAYFARTDQWLGAPLPPAVPGLARAGLVRRYLHCYGPSTAGDFAEWAGIAPAQAARTWALIEAELAETNFEGRRTWLLKADVPQLMSPTAATGVRFLPPHEPLLQMRDRSTLIPDKSLHKKLWRAVGNPGVLIVDGKPVAAWRSRKQGRRLNITVEVFADIVRTVRPPIEAEAATLAPYRGCSSVDVRFEELE